MDLQIVPITAWSWPFYKTGLRSWKLQAPRALPERGFVLLRSLTSNQASHEAVGGACLVRAGRGLLLVQHAFARPWTKPGLAEECAPLLATIGQHLSMLAALEGALLVAFPTSKLGFDAVAKMGFTAPVQGFVLPAREPEPAPV